jgi:DNA-directed RNA polymerase specialized sigma24 family protein
VSLRKLATSKLVDTMLSSRRRVVWALLTYTEWWHAPTTSILQVGAARRTKEFPDGLRAGLLETLEERAELCRRFWHLDLRDRQILFLWYVQQLSVEEISRIVGVSRRHFFRCRSKAIDAIVDLGEPQQAAS